MFAVDSAGIVTKVNDEGTRWERPTSGRRIRANRRNALNSTGPTTDLGKKRSAQNAVKHGVLASSLEPIERGPFAEDSAAFWDRVRLVVAALDPRDPLEERMARQVACQFVRYDRLDALEAAAHESAARLTQAQRSYLDSADHLGELEALARGLYYYLTGVVELSDVPYRDYAGLMRSVGPAPGLRIKGLWDDENEPTSDGDWERAFRFLLEKLWRTVDDAAVWALQLQRRLMDEWSAVEGLEREIVADHVLEGAFDKVTRYHGRTTNDLARLFDVYQILRSRSLPEAGSNEPNDELT